jgi:hypothetical protein
MVCKIIKKFMDAWSHKFKVGDVLVSLSNYSSRIMSFQECMPYVDDIDFEYIEISNIQ